MPWKKKLKPNGMRYQRLNGTYCDENKPNCNRYYVYKLLRKQGVTRPKGTFHGKLSSGEHSLTCSGLPPTIKTSPHHGTTLQRITMSSHADAGYGPRKSIEGIKLIRLYSSKIADSNIMIYKEDSCWNSESLSFSIDKTWTWILVMVSEFFFLDNRCYIWKRKRKMTSLK